MRKLKIGFNFPTNSVGDLVKDPTMVSTLVSYPNVLEHHWTILKRFHWPHPFEMQSWTFFSATLFCYSSILTLILHLGLHIWKLRIVDCMQTKTYLWLYFNERRRFILGFSLSSTCGEWSRVGDVSGDAISNINVIIGAYARILLARIYSNKAVRLNYHSKLRFV